MQLTEIREITRHQHLRGVGVVELSIGSQRVRIRVRPHGPGGGDGAGKEKTAELADAMPSPVAASDPSRTVVRSEALGFLRRTHPARLGARVEVGDSVEQGQPLALLHVGDTYTCVSAPATGVIESVLAQEGQRVDYGMPLFVLKGAGTQP